MTAHAVYREWPLTGRLATVADRAWTVTGVGAAGHLVLPDGCMDLVWTGGALMVAGPMTRAATASAAASPPGPVMGIRLRPGAARALGVPAEHLTDAVVPAADVHQGFRHTAERIGSAGSPSAMAAVLTREADGLLDVAAVDGATLRAAALLMSGRAEVAAVAGAVGYSDRALRRIVTRTAGLSPSHMRRVGRLQGVLSAARDHPDASVAAIAAAAGYTDESHCARDIRELAGLTPAGLLRARGLRPAPAVR